MGCIATRSIKIISIFKGIAFYESRNKVLVPQFFSKLQQNQFDFGHLRENYRKLSSEFSYDVMLRGYIWHAKCKKEREWRVPEMRDDHDF